MKTVFKVGDRVYEGLKFQTDKFGDKLIYKLENGKYHLIKDERLSITFGTEEVCKNPNSISADEYWWK